MAGHRPGGRQARGHRESRQGVQARPDEADGGAAAMTRSDEPIQPMTLGNMRQNGVRGLFVTCPHCGYETAVNMDAWPDDVPVPSFAPRMRSRSAASLARLPFRTGK